MHIVVRENGSKQRLIAYVVENEAERELVRTDKGRDNLLNKIEDMNLSRLTVEFE